MWDKILEDDRFWKILFEEACVEGKQAEIIEQRLREEVFANNGWIPVNERFPKSNEDGFSEDVLVSFSDSCNVFIAFYDFNKKGWYVHGSCPYIGKVIAWRSLPNPYTLKDND